MASQEMPVLVGVGQVVDHWTAGDGAGAAPSPLSLATGAAERALADAGVAGLAGAIDTIAMARTNETSYPGAPQPNGVNGNLPGTLARTLGADPSDMIYEIAGGQSPQALVNEMAAKIHLGHSQCALVVGAEAIGATKAARRGGVTIDWTDDDPRPFDDRGFGPRMLTRLEAKHGLVVPAYFYGLFQTAMAHALGDDKPAHRARMSRLFAGFSAVAANNPYAQFGTERSADWLATPSAENRPIADPFLKWHVAQDAVNQAAAILVMSDAKADELGISADRRVYLHGAGEASDDQISERPKVDGSWAMDVALNRALDQAGLDAGAIDLFDLYSCFPCAVMSACQVLGIDHDAETRPLTVTGGLPFFGGPGNNYSMHGIASMAERLRDAPGTRGLVLANGGWMTKEAAAIYSTTRPAVFVPVAPGAKPVEQVQFEEAPTGGTLETYTVTHGKTGPDRAIAFCRTGEGKRFIAVGDGAAVNVLSGDENLIGHPVTATTADEVNTFSLA
ncbi:MAG: acetyl-CoA acetyltransferase [Pseudomonadota bacterium]